jgi:hypothetical protein
MVDAAAFPHHQRRRWCARASTKGAVSYQPGASPQVSRPTRIAPPTRNEGSIQRIPDYEVGNEVGHQFRGITNMIFHQTSHEMSHEMKRAFNLGRCPRLVWLRAFGPPERSSADKRCKTHRCHFHKKRNCLRAAAFQAEVLVGVVRHGVQQTLPIGGFRR